MSVSSSN